MNSKPSLLLLLSMTIKFFSAMPCAGMSWRHFFTKALVLLYDDGHYDVITSLPGFFGTSYFCMRCLKPYDNQGPHACDNNPDHCSAYLQTGCPDYTEAQCRSLPATQTCDSCRWTFYGTACFTNHMSKTQTGKTADHQQLSVCTSRRKCEEVEAPFF